MTASSKNLIGKSIGLKPNNSRGIDSDILFRVVNIGSYSNYYLIEKSADTRVKLEAHISSFEIIVGDTRETS